MTGVRRIKNSISCKKKTRALNNTRKKLRKAEDTL